MSERKRKLQDPEYEDFAFSLPKQPHLSDEEARKITEERVRAIIKKHFATEERFREEQLFELQVTLSKAQETLADFRRAVVQNAFARDDLLTSAHPQSTSGNQSSGDQTRIHPAVKKLLGWGKRPPPPIAPGVIGLPMTRRAAASLTATSLSEALPSTSKDTSAPTNDVSTQDPSTSTNIPRASTSEVDDSSQPSTSQLQPSTIKPSFITNQTLPSCSRTISPSTVPTKTGVGTTKSLTAPEGGKARVPRHLPPSEGLGSAKPCRPMRMVGRVLKHLVVGNTSRCLSLESRPGRASHKWMLYVRFRDNQTTGNLVRHVVFTLHPSYAPNEVVKVDQPPFHLYRRGWGEFLARVVIHFRHPQDKPVEVTHHLKLDHSGSGLERLGSETHVKVWLHEVQSTDNLPTGRVEPESIEAESETEETDPAAPYEEESQSHWVENNASLDDQKMEVDMTETIESSLDAVGTDIRDLSKSLVVKQEPHSPFVPWPGENEEIDIKEEPLDVPNSAMGLDIFYDDPANFTEEVVEDVIEEVEVKEESEEIDWPAVKLIKSETYAPCEEKSLEASVTEMATTSVESGVFIDPSSSPMGSASSSSVSKASPALPTLVPNNCLPKDGNIIIKLLQPSGQVVYMQMCQASNTLTPIGPPGQVIRTSGEVIRTTGQSIPNAGQIVRTTGQVIRAAGKSGQVIPTPGQIIRTTGQSGLFIRNPGQVAQTTGQSVRPTIACGVANVNKQIAVNGHIGTRMVVVARPRLNGAAFVKPAGRSVLRSVLKPLAIREVSIKQDPSEKITLIGSLMTTDPLSGMIASQEAQSFLGIVKHEPSILGPIKREPSSNSGGFMRSQPMGLMAAAIQHRNAISRTMDLCSAERCPSIERMLGMLASALPLVDARALKPAFRSVHPYTAPSLATFLEWPLGKRCAAERLRAMAVRQLLLTTARPPSDIWPTRHIQRWLLLHGFTPVQADPALQQPTKPLRSSHSHPALALAWLDQLTEKDDVESDVDIITVDERPKEKRRPVSEVEPDYSHLETLPMSAEMERRSLQLAETTREIGITLRPEVIAGEMLYHAATRVMLEAVQLFTEEILRRSLCKAWERNHNRPPSSLELRDIRAAVLQYFPLLSNCGLGQIPPTNQGS